MKQMILRSRWSLSVGLIVALGAVIVAATLSIGVGSVDIDARVVVASILSFDDGDFNHLIVRTIRLPRVIAAVLVGAGMASAGAVMQGLTSNPLASPGLLGVNAGASLFVVVGISASGSLPLLTYSALSVAGAAVAAALVYGVSSAGSGTRTPVKLALTGVMFSAFAAAVTTWILITDLDTFDQVRFWTVGSVAGRDMELVRWMAPIIIVGLVFALIVARQITTLSLGEATATGLGQKTGRVRAIGAFCVVLMAGGSVGLAGPVGFLGLVVPHLARPLCGVNYRWVIPYSAVLGALLAVAADTAGRAVLKPQEVPIGVMLAAIGAPFLIYIARWKMR